MYNISKVLGAYVQTLTVGWLDLPHMLEWNVVLRGGDEKKKLNQIKITKKKTKENKKKLPKKNILCI